jgi:hypothetical protein
LQPLARQQLVENDAHRKPVGAVAVVGPHEVGRLALLPLDWHLDELGCAPEEPVRELGDAE